MSPFLPSLSSFLDTPLHSMLTEVAHKRPLLLFGLAVSALVSLGRHSIMLMQPPQPDEPLRWTWIRSGKKNPSVLVAQYSARNYGELLKLTSPVNQAYAHKKGYDYVSLEGVGLASDHDPDALLDLEAHRHMLERHATFNKIPLLETALERNYDWLLILDADAMVVDLDRDLLAPYPYFRKNETSPVKWNDAMLLALKVEEEIEVQYWNINVGVTLWNLKHPLTRRVVKLWKHKSFIDIAQGKDDDQWILQQIFRHDIGEPQSSRVVYPVLKEFLYERGTFIKHFIRGTGSWTDIRLKKRKEAIQSAVKDVCRKYGKAMRKSSLRTGRKQPC